MVSIKNIKSEIISFLRNSDVLPTSVRGVTTTTDTGTFSADLTHLINVSNIKNIRSITIDAAPLVFGTDYTYDIDYNDSGTIKCQITFTTAQTGDYVITYDYGSDKIYPDFPRDDLSIDSYPRIAADILSSTSNSFGIGGNAFISSYLMTVVVYSDNVDDIEDYIQTIKDSLINNANDFYYLNYVKPSSIGPVIEDPERSNEIVKRNIDFDILFDVQVAA